MPRPASLRSRDGREPPQMLGVQTRQARPVSLASPAQRGVAKNKTGTNAKRIFADLERDDSWKAKAKEQNFIVTDPYS